METAAKEAPPDELARMDAVAQAEAVADGELAQCELVEAAIERIERIDPHLNAVAVKLFAEARGHADAASGPYLALESVERVADPAGCVELAVDPANVATGDPGHRLG